MSKNFFSKFIIGLLFVAVAVVWLLYVIMPDKFAGFNPIWILTAFLGVLGIVFIMKGFTNKTLTYVKKFYIIVGAAFIIGAVLSLVGTLIQDKLVLPIIAIVIAVAGLFCILAVGGKKWDTADNQKVGYKNYYQRKEEEEKAKAKEERKNNN